MRYSIKEVADISGISTRTLRYYDQIDLLKPDSYTDSGYRIYSEKEIDRLQQILLYRSMEIKLEQIQEILENPNFDTLNALEKHYRALQEEKRKVNRLIKTVEKTIQYKKGEIEMTSAEKFEGFKKERLEENERLYGEEIREQYGEDTINESNKKFMNLSEEDFNQMQDIEKHLFQSLDALSESKDLDSQEAKDVYLLHKKWLSYSWPEYSAEAHKGLVEMYVADERFAKYYNDRTERGDVTLLRDAVIKYADDSE